MKNGPPEYLQARRRLEALLPELLEAVARPHFQAATRQEGAPEVAFNDLALSALILSLDGYAESLVAEGRPDQAALVYELVFRLGAGVSQDGGIVQTMMGVSYQALAFQSLVGHLSPSSELSPNQWAGLSLAVAAVTPTPLTMQAALEQDLVFGTDFLLGPRASYDGDARHLRGVYLLPGMRARDQRVYHNVMGALLEEARGGLVNQAAPAASWKAILKGETGPGVAPLLPQYDTQSARLTLHGAKMGGLAAMAGVCAYRARYGKLPESLANLDEMRLLAPGGAPWSTVRGVYYEVRGQQGVVGIQVPPELFTRAGLDREAARQQEVANSAYFGLGERGYYFLI
jgi:hypothetical protein